MSEDSQNWNSRESFLILEFCRPKATQGQVASVLKLPTEVSYEKPLLNDWMSETVKKAPLLNTLFYSYAFSWSCTRSSRVLLGFVYLVLDFLSKSP